MKKCRIESGQYIGEISALSFLHLPSHLSSLPFLLAGTGSQIILYDLLNGTLIRSFQVFDGIRVHGICCAIIDSTQNPCSFRVVVFGERRVKLFTLLLHSHNQQLSANLILLNSLPNFRHWVLDVRFLKGCPPSSSQDENSCIAVGCSDNSVYFWDIAQSIMNFKVMSPDECLLYSMSIWGDQVEGLYIAAGTIFNEIIVWKVTRPEKECSNGTTSFEVDLQQYEAFHVCRLSGHEGSIFRIAWSPDGSKLLTASDDRCGRIWSVSSAKKISGIAGEEVVSHSAGPVLFGHTARVWDCCISESLIVTVGEDCTCRVWGLDGIQLKMMKEHIGRGVWRCLYDPDSSLLVTAGFDSSIKVYKLQVSLASGSMEVAEGLDPKEISLLRIPNSSGHVGLTDSKSEYVRCLQFIRDDTLYVATNKGYLFHAKLSDTGEATWTELMRVTEDAPIICMDLLSRDPIEDRVVLGDGKGNVTAVNIVTDASGIPKVGQTYVWFAEKERQLLGTFLCESLGYRFVFTADPRGTVKLWELSSRMESDAATVRGDSTLLAEFVSCFGTRIMCLDASFEEEVLVCGDLRGNLVIFPFSKGQFLDSSTVKVKPLSYFKGGHGISSVCSVSMAMSASSHVEIHSTGGDGCICYLEYDKHQQRLEFIGMKQVKELSLIRSTLSGKYIIGFASADFIIWNLISETKVVQIPCGGWRRPHSYFLGHVPERMNCFAFVKEEIIYVHRNWVTESEGKIYPQNLHPQFHGRETHSLCFVSENSESGWVATGCEDGTVRLTSYDAGDKDWSASRLLGEHVGGSAVRSICFVKQKLEAENPSLLISVGAKRVLTAWQQKLGGQMSFRWLSTDMPLRNCSTREKDKKFLKTENISESCESDNASSRVCSGDEYENDWRYLDVTAFLVKVADTRISVCFIVVACSDATVSLRALVLPYRLWFDVAFFVPLASPVLALQHVIIPDHQISHDNCGTFCSYIAISGSTDGSMAFWDLTESVTIFIQRVAKLESSDLYIDCQKRPRTGRGSQGGRWWKSLSSSSAPNKLSSEDEPTMSDSCQNEAKNLDDSPLEIRPCYTLNNIHKSGVNCLHVSDIKASSDSKFQFHVISGGDDQALHSLTINLSQCQSKYQIGVLYHDNISSAHSSAVKGVWTDGEWVFSTGLDQRVRCWSLEEHGKLSERAHLIISVPEPEALNARACTRNHYEIAVAGRGMQMVDFFLSEGI